MIDGEVKCQNAVIEGKFYGKLRVSELLSVKESAVFAFINRRRNQVKLLMWTRGGFTVVHKRLEVGTFTFAARLRSDAKSVELDVHELSMLLEGIDIQRARISPRWEPPLDTRSTHV